MSTGPPVILGIDPGPVQSGYAYIGPSTRHPLSVGILPNDDLLKLIQTYFKWVDPATAHVAIEMVASYGMPVGREVFDTCVWVGRYQQALHHTHPYLPVDLVYRRDIKLHFCGNPRAGDANIRRALVDRFTPGAANHGKGTKHEPGWFHGFTRDVWAAYALAVYVADTLEQKGRAAV